MSTSVIFTPKQAYVATLAMRLGKAMPVATIVGWSPQQLAAATSSANAKLSQAQASSLGIQAVGKTPSPDQPLTETWCSHCYNRSV